MRQVARFGLAIALGLVSTSAAAQTRPDFSGRWSSEPVASDTAGRGGRAGGRGRTGDMGSGWGQNITVTQDAKQLTVEYAFFVRGDMQPPLRFRYALDGAETKNSVMMGHGVQASTSKTEWQGDKLLITTSQVFRNPDSGQPVTSEVTRTLSLEAPSALVVETVIGGVLGGPPSTTRTVYRKL